MQHGRGHLIDRIALDAASRVRAVGSARAGVEQPQEIVELGCGGDRGPGIASVIFLANGDGGRDAVDLVDFGLFHALQELAGVGGERLHIAPLALGIDGVENERRFAGAGDAGHDGDEVVGNGRRQYF